MSHKKGPSCIKIIPAILTNSVEDLRDKLRQIQGAVDWAQIDLMDGKFVNNTSISLKDLSRIKTKLNLEAHLMVLRPEKLFSDCQKAKIKRVIFHFEAVNNLDEILRTAEKYNFQIGVALNPETSVSKIKPFLNNNLDEGALSVCYILLLSVHPGFSSQKFIPPVLKKIKDLKKISPQIKIGVDGGINQENIKKVAAAGADYLMAGSAVFKNGEVRSNIKKLQSAI